MTFKRFTAPQIETVETPEIPLVLSMIRIGVAAEHTFVCGPIPFPFRILRIQLVQETLTAGNEHFYFLVSRNSDVYTVAPPIDLNILNMSGYDNYLTAHVWDENIEFTPNVDVLEKDMYLKFHASELGGVWYMLMAIVTITPLPEA